jgi:hypothetical protein
MIIEGDNYYAIEADNYADALQIVNDWENEEA